MIELVKSVIEFYLQKMSAPDVQDLTIGNSELLTKQWSCFVTVFHKWEVRGSAWNIQKISSSIAEELIINTVHAISKDDRFSPLTIWEWKDIKLRVDFITERKVLARTDDEAKSWTHTLAKIDPVKNWVVVIKKDYSKTATILPNIDPKILVWSDYQEKLSAKLWEAFDENKYIIYQISTVVERDY